MPDPVDETPSPPLGQSRWTGAWMRVAVWHPLLCTPGLALAWFLALLPGSDDNDVGWTFWIVLLGAAVGLACTIVTIARRPAPLGKSGALALVGVAATAVALVGGFFVWLYALGLACHGAYECPF